MPLFQPGLKAIQNPARGKARGVDCHYRSPDTTHSIYQRTTKTGTTAKAHLLDLLLEPLRGCAGLYTYRQELMNEVLKMPVLEVQDRLDHLQRIHFPGT
jgi:hypothetical protein